MIIQSTKVYYEEKFQPLQIEITKDSITGIYNYNQFKVDKDYKNLQILPGLCDSHVHGYDGGSVFYATIPWLKKWCKYLPNEGITSVVAGISSFPKDKLLKACDNIGTYIDKDNKNGAHIIGVYEEGPFICSGKERGAQNLEFQIIPTKKIIDEFNDASHNHLIYVMIAPEMLNGKYDVIDYCRSKGMAVALGHTAATYDVCAQAIKHGANSFTHTYNGMKGLHHREPGVVGAAMYHDECYAELICDGVHVNKIAANILAKTKGKDRLIIVTDSISLKGKKYGKYKTDDGTEDITICKDNICRLESGTLCGSCRKLNENLAYAIKEANIDYVTAINAVTINPMKLFNINNKGLIKVGYKADIAIFDSNFNTKEVYIDGKIQKLN